MPAPSPPPASRPARRMIADLGLGAEVDEIFLIGSAQQSQARNGPYWRLEFRDASGGMEGKIWSPASQNFAYLSAGMMALVKGRVSSYRDRLELSVEAMRILGEEECAGLDFSLFMPSSSRNPDDMMRELLLLARETLLHKPWLRLVESILGDEHISAALRMAPAAKSMHHAYAGGLLEHTLSVARLCLRLAAHYPQLDRQALFTGAVCHDLGKLWELSSGLAVEYTQAGKLLGHIPLLLDRLTPFMAASGLEPELVEHLQHMVLSHHGSYEFGSPRLPATAEALALHYADIMDAKLQQVENALSGLEEQGWSPYVPSLERSLFRAKKTPAAPFPAPLDAEDGALSGPPPFPLPEELAQSNAFSRPRPSSPAAALDGPADAEQTETLSDSPPENTTFPAAKAGQPLSLFRQCSLLSKE